MNYEYLHTTCWREDVESLLRESADKGWSLVSHAIYHDFWNRERISLIFRRPIHGQDHEKD